MTCSEMGRDARASSSLGPLEQPGGHVVRYPGVAERQHPVEHGRAVPADQDGRMRPLRGLGPGPDPVELHELPVVGRLRRRPDRLHRLDPLAQHRHPPPRVGAMVGHLRPVPARADAELEPPPGQVVDAGHLLGGGDRVPLDHQADAGPDAQPRGGAQRRRHRHEQVERVRVVPGKRRFTAGRVLGRHVRVLGEEQRLVPALLSKPRDRVRPDPLMARKDRNAKFHTPIVIEPG